MVWSEGWRRGAVLARWLGLLLAGPAAGPAAAAGLCETGRHQSPIDIVGAQPAALPAFEARYRPTPLVADRDDETVRLRLAGGSRLVLGRETLSLQQLHFHRPGGDRLQGESFPWSLHLLHRTPGGALVGVVVPVRYGAALPALEAALPHLPGPGEHRRTDAGALVDPAQWLPAARGYYAYTGSLTAPPCTEGVRWLVMKQAIEISREQGEALARLVPVNMRDVQPLHGRRVLERS